MEVYGWMACGVFPLTAVLIYIVGLTNFLYYLSLYSKNIVTIRLKFVLTGGIALTEGRGWCSWAICNIIGHLRLPAHIHWIFITMHRASPEVGEWLTTGFQNTRTCTRPSDKRQTTTFVWNQGRENPAPPSMVQEELKAAAPAGVHAHAAGGWCVHTLQLITLCTSDCKNQDRLIIISPCQVSKY